MRTQIRTLQVPTNWGTAAFMPVPAASPTAEFNGQNITVGSPGNRPVPSPRPAAIQDNSWGGRWQPSSVAPNYILPSIYVAVVNRTMRFPGSLARINPSPIPATPVSSAVIPLWGKPRIGGNTVTAAIRPFTQWKTYGAKKTGRR